MSKKLTLGIEKNPRDLKLEFRILNSLDKRENPTMEH